MLAVAAVMHSEPSPVFMLIPCLFMVLWILVVVAGVAAGVLGTAFWIWMIVDCAKKEKDEGNTKLVWILVILFAHIIGAAIYYFVRRPQRRTELGR
jgi:sterol desaturase/sphingolipid hydroxylase (fatty acid hydroxylase superfamily)